MARLVTLSTLRTEILDRYDLPTSSSATWETTTALNRSINMSLQSFYALLVDCYGDDYFSTYQDITTSNGVDMTSLPERCYRLYNLTWLRGTDDPVILDTATARDANLSGLTARAWTGYTPKYRLHGMSAVRWFPTPNATYTIRVTYAALPSDLSSDGSTFDAGPGWDEWVVNDVCAKLSAREEKDPSVFFAERARVEGLIREQAPLRMDTSCNLLLDRSAEEISAYELRDKITYGAT